MSLFINRMEFQVTFKMYGFPRPGWVYRYTMCNYKKQCCTHQWTRSIPIHHTRMVGCFTLHSKHVAYAKRIIDILFESYWTYLKHRDNDIRLLTRLRNTHQYKAHQFQGHMYTGYTFFMKAYLSAVNFLILYYQNTWISCQLPDIKLSWRLN